jgi:UV DNA damage endonuclease
MIRWGLCCLFNNEPIRFRRTTASFLVKKHREEQLAYLSEICHHNAGSLMKALEFCRDHGIGDFRINSQILPLKTHPQCGYDLAELPESHVIRSDFESCRRFAQENNLRLTLHPDQFVLLSSENPQVTEKSIEELNYQAEFAEIAGVDVINIHGGGAYGNKPEALKRLRRNVEVLDDRLRRRLTLENDDRVYSPGDLLPVCRDMGLPLVYDVHHHRCLEDGCSEQKTTDLALSTWNREPLFHLSSPLNSWDGPHPRKHHDFIDLHDFPVFWRDLDITVEVEAKAKEVAVLQLKCDLEGNIGGGQKKSDV